MNTTDLVIAELKRFGDIGTTGDVVARNTGLTRTAITRIFGELRESGEIRKIGGHGRGTRYVVVGYTMWSREEVPPCE